VTYTSLPISIAWETFERKNGVSSYAELRDTILKYRESRGRSNGIDPEIGCSVLAQPFFFKRENWIPIPEDWKSNIVRGRTYNTQTAIGKKLFADVQTRLAYQGVIKETRDKSSKAQDQSTEWNRDEPSETERYGSEYLTRARIGQGSFRALITNAADRIRRLESHSHIGSDSWGEI